MPRFGRQRDSRVINLRLVSQGLVRAISWRVSSPLSLSLSPGVPFRPSLHVPTTDSARVNRDL